MWVLPWLLAVGIEGGNFVVCIPTKLNVRVVLGRHFMRFTHGYLVNIPKMQLPTGCRPVLAGTKHSPAVRTHSSRPQTQGTLKTAVQSKSRIALMYSEKEPWAYGIYGLRFQQSCQHWAQLANITMHLYRRLAFDSNTLKRDCNTNWLQSMFRVVLCANIFLHWTSICSSCSTISSARCPTGDTSVVSIDRKHSSLTSGLLCPTLYTFILFKTTNRVG